METWKYVNRAWQREQCLAFSGNGYIGGRIPLDGHTAGGNRFTSEIAGFYVGAEEVMCDVPHPLNAPLRLDGQHARPVWRGFTQTLDLRDGVFRTDYPDATGAVRVETEFFFHRSRRHVAAYRLKVWALREVEIELAPQLDAGQLRQKPCLRRSREDGWMLEFGDAERKAAQVMHVSSSHGAGERHGSELTLGRSVSARLKSGEQLTLEVIVATTTGAEPLVQAQREAEAAAHLGFEALRREHAATMHSLWSEFDFSCADPFTERRARSALFYLLSAFRGDVIWGGAATGLAGSGGGWGGCVFWDTEFYMFPALLPLFPKLAKNTVLYRCQTSEGARKNALDNSEDGLRFAWESRRSGLEFAGHFAAERHIGSDVAFAAWWYAQSTGDRDFWNEKGRDILEGVARFWAGRVQREGTTGRWSIPRVIPADEHVADHYREQLVCDSVMTNAYAAWVLKIAAEQPGFGYEEGVHWREIAAHLHLPRDEKRGLWLEYAGYDDHPIKQADVGHLYFPLDPKAVGADAADIRRNVSFYADRERETGIGIFHSPFVYGAAMSRAGDVEGVRRFLDWSWHNVAGGYDMPRELMHTTGPTITAAGAFLGLLMYGVLGLENMGDELTAHPCVPDSIGEISLSGIKFRGGVYQLTARSTRNGKAHSHLQRLA